MPGEYAEEDVLNAFDEEDEARARSMASHFGIDFDAPLVQVKPHRTKYRHPYLNGDSDG